MIEVEYFYPVNDSVYEAFSWCRKKFGPINSRDTRWDYGYGVFSFRDPRDAVLFMLRWS